MGRGLVLGASGRDGDALQRDLFGSSFCLDQLGATRWFALLGRELVKARQHGAMEADGDSGGCGKTDKAETICFEG